MIGTNKDKDGVVFKTAVEILTDNNINYWVCHGTLLGIIRENRLLPWDHDIDFAVWHDEHPKEEILKIFAMDKRFKQEIVPEEINSLHFATVDKRVDINFYSRDTDTAYIKWIISPENIFLKFYYFSVNFITTDIGISKAIESSNGKAIELIKLLLIIPLIFVKFILPKLLKSKLHKNLLKKLGTIGYSYPMELMKCKTMRFLNVNIVVPVEPEEVLRFTYGEGWKIPKQDYVWYKEAKNLLRQD
jgi:phosphorylcholine metabolism protein LicD